MFHTQRLLLLLIFGSVCSDEFISTVSCPSKCQCSTLYGSTVCRGLQLTQLPGDIWPEVKILDLTENAFTSVPEELSKYRILSHLILAKNNVTRLSKHSLNIKSLKILDLSQNKIIKWSDVHAEAINLTSALVELNLSHNPIRYISTTSSLASTSLKILKMQGCSLTHIPDTFLTNLVKLNSFIISGNYLRQRNKVMQLKSDTLEILDISYCNLEQINLTNLRFLKFINLTGNYISQIIPEYFKNRQLKVLDLYNNTIKSVNKDAFINLPAMETLNLSTNTFTYLSPETFVHNKMLRTLKLSRTYMTQLVRFNISTLEYLDFSMNEIQYFSANSLTLMPALKYLNIAKNLITKVPKHIRSSSLLHLDLNTCKITDIMNETFTYLPNLEVLHMAGNRLTDLKPYYLPKYLKEITLYNNPWRCECYSNEFHDLFNYVMSLQTKVSGEHMLLCQSPENISGYPWLDACRHVWYTNSTFGRSDRLWLYIVSMILAISMIFCTTISIRRVYQVKLLREQQERERRLEAQARLRRLRQQQRQSMQAQQNAPDPRELVRPPSYAEAILLPRIDGSCSSLAGSQHSLSASNPNLAKKKRRRRAKQSRDINSEQSREVKTTESTEENEQGTSSEPRIEFDRQSTLNSEDDLETDEDMTESRTIRIAFLENNENRS